MRPLMISAETFNEFPDPVVMVDLEGRILYLNPKAEELFGRSLAAHPPLRWAELFDRAEDSAMPGFLRDCLGPQAQACPPLRLRTAGGREGTYHPSVSLLRDASGASAGCLAVLRSDGGDPAVQHEEHEQLVMLTSILENFPTPFFTVDPNLVITYMNRRLEQLTGYTREEAVHRMTCASVLSTVQCHTGECLLKQAMEKRQPMSGVRRVIVDRDGRKIPVVVNASIITDPRGRVIGGYEAIRDITPIVEAEKKIEFLTNMTQEGILMVDEDLRIIFANQRMVEIFARPHEQLVGLDVSEFLPVQHYETIVDMVRDAASEEGRQLCFCSTLQPGGDPSAHQRVYETCMGASRVGKSVITSIYFHDLTERIEIERQLRHANSFLQNIIRSSVDGIVVVDKGGHVLIFNEGAERILGYKAEEVIGDPEMFAKFYDPQVARENMRRMRSGDYGPPGKLSTTRITLVHKSGEKVPVNFSAAIIKEGDREVGSVGIFSDLREHLRIRRELEEARYQLLQAEKIASLGRLSAGVAHEINNPLAGILIYAEMLMKEVGDHPQWRQDLEEIIHQTLRCKQIVTRLLEFSRQPLGERVSYDMGHLAARCVELLCHQPLFHDVRFAMDLPADLPDMVGDPGQLQQVFTNLIINAANAMDGKGQITLSGRYDAGDDTVSLQFADSGPGIPPEIRDKIFEPFFTTKAPGSGTGLGLSVAYGIVQQHGGSIEAGTAPGGGALFTVILPRESPEATSETFDE